jgi:hypothetical protein
MSPEDDDRRRHRERPIGFAAQRPPDWRALPLTRTMRCGACAQRRRSARTSILNQELRFRHGLEITVRIGLNPRQNAEARAVLTRLIAMQREKENVVGLAKAEEHTPGSLTENGADGHPSAVRLDLSPPAA